MASAHCSPARVGKAELLCPKRNNIVLSLFKLRRPRGFSGKIQENFSMGRAAGA